MGDHVLHHRRGNDDRTGRLAGGAVRAEAALRDLHRRVHDRFHAVRCGAVVGADGAVPAAARHVQCGPGAAVAIHPAGYLPARAARLRHGDLGRGGDDRTDHGPDARRLPDRDVQLALGILHQPAVRCAGRARAARIPAQRPAAEQPAVRLDRLCRAGRRDRGVAADAGPRANPGLVQLPRDRH